MIKSSLLSSRFSQSKTDQIHNKQLRCWISCCGKKIFQYSFIVCNFVRVEWTRKKIKTSNFSSNHTSSRKKNCLWNSLNQIFFLGASVISAYFMKGKRADYMDFFFYRWINNVFSIFITIHIFHLCAVHLFCSIF